jgi:hypothetical protein
MMWIRKEKLGYLWLAILQIWRLLSPLSSSVGNMKKIK